MSDIGIALQWCFTHHNAQSVLIVLFVVFVITALYAKRRRLQVLFLRTQSNKNNHGISFNRTQIRRCNISHRRMFPEAHAFKYSYVTVGIPVRSPSSNWLLSVDATKWWRRGVFHVTARDHLYRGSGGSNLSENLDSYLGQQNLNPTDYPHVYLVTSARFLNYKFSPASFWYLYTTGLRLEFIIAEVNNTFGERRMYFFPASDTTCRFRSACEKDFHVSPFSSRKGSYSISSTDPAREKSWGITVVLRSSKGHPKLVTRWWSIADAIGPAVCSTTSPISFAIWWGWTVLVTYPRIVFEAITLAQLRKLSLWYRPEPKVTAVSRDATASEVLLGSLFVHYLQHLVQHADLDLNLSLITGINKRDNVWIRSEPSNSKEPTVKLEILTPQFYRQMVAYRQLTEFLTYALLGPFEENHTARCTDAERVIASLKTVSPLCGEGKQQILPVRVGLGLGWSFFERIRVKKPLKGTYPEGFPRSRRGLIEQSSSPSRTDGTCFLDEFVRRHCDASTQLQYICAAAQLQLRTKIMGMTGGE